VQLASMPWDSIVMAMATILMFSILIALRGAFIRAGEFNQMLDCSDEAESERAVSIKVSAAWELR